MIKKRFDGEQDKNVSKKKKKKIMKKRRFELE